MSAQPVDGIGVTVRLTVELMAEHDVLEQVGETGLPRLRLIAGSHQDQHIEAEHILKFRHLHNQNIQAIIQGGFLHLVGEKILGGGSRWNYRHGRQQTQDTINGTGKFHGVSPSTYKPPC